MSLQYIQDAKGKVTAVVIPIKEWEKMKDRIESTTSKKGLNGSNVMKKEVSEEKKKSAKEKKKEKLKAQIAEGFKEARLYLDGKIELQTWDDFVKNEL